VGEGLAQGVSSALLKNGLSSRQASLQDALASENALIISPAGAIPLPLLQNASLLEAQNSRVIVIEALPGKTIGEDGSIAQQNASLPENFELVRLSPQGEGSALPDVALRAIFLPRADVVRVSAQPGNATIVVPVNASAAYCRAVGEMPGGRHRFSDSGKLLSPPGSLAGPQRLAAGKSGIFEFSLPGNEEVGRDLGFFAVAYLPEGEAFREEIAGGVITHGWASRFSMGFARGGQYTVRVMDQFARVHASAFVQVPALSVVPASSDGSRYEFLALVDGKPVEGAMSAQLDNGTPKNYSVREGRLIVWSAPQPGSHTMEFEHSGLLATYHFVSRPSGMVALADTYLRFGVPAAMFVLAVFLLLRAGRKAKYSITFPEAAPADPCVLEVTGQDMLFAWAAADRKFGGFCLPCYPHEIAAGLLAGKGGHSKPANAHSVLRILRRLSEQGVFAEHEGAFIPKAKMGGFSARELLMLRTIHECMLERGLRFSRKPVIALEKGGLELALFRGRESALSGIGKACRALVFESKDGIAGFEKELSAPGAVNSRIRLALCNDKLLLVAAARGDLWRILP
jgi:hypothetical protein